LKFVLNFPEALYALGTVHFRQGNLDAAFQNFERVLRTNRNHGDAYFSRGNILARRRQLFDAIEDYNRALGIYDGQLVALQESIEEFEVRGLLRKADAERRRRDRLEANIQRARESKARVEREIVGGQ
jgi:tetratricopeptide (TPR) repeat protein